MAKLLGHRQTKGAATDKPNLLPPRHISTLPDSVVRKVGPEQLITHQLVDEWPVRPRTAGIH
jgi:hypothetical protein